MARRKKKGLAARRRRRRRVLICTPEITELPVGMGNAAQYIRAKGGGMGDISAGLIRYLFADGTFTLHVALPKYDHKIREYSHISNREMSLLVPLLQRHGVHLVADSAFSRLTGVYDDSDQHPRVHRALAFQRYIINQLLDEVRPDVVHCNDWMTGLVPAAAHERGIKSVFTLHNVFTEYDTPASIDRAGIDIRPFLDNLFFENFPHDTQHNWRTNRIDFTTSGLLAADVVNTVSETFLDEIVGGDHAELIPPAVREMIRRAHTEGRALGILNAPDDTVDPKVSQFVHNFDVDTVEEGKAINRETLQRELSLEADKNAPLFFWPSRLYLQKGPELLTAFARRFVDETGAQIAFIANGDSAVENSVRDLTRRCRGRIAFQPFDERLSELGKAAADFVLMPSRYEPCGLPQMEGPRFGTLPVARLTGGIRDTVQELDVDASKGNGFAFEDFTAEALAAAMHRAVEFRRQPDDVRLPQLKRIMRDSFTTYSLENTAKRYIEVYERLIDGA